MPERWLRGDQDNNLKFFSNLVWGHGARMCIGKYNVTQDAINNNIYIQNPLGFKKKRQTSVSIFSIKIVFNIQFRTYPVTYNYTIFILSCYFYSLNLLGFLTVASHAMVCTINEH